MCSLIKPWSVVGKYVRRCIIIYERMPFEQLVAVCQQTRTQFAHLAAFINAKLTASGTLAAAATRLLYKAAPPARQPPAAPPTPTTVKFNSNNNNNNNSISHHHPNNQSNSPSGVVGGGGGGGTLFLNDESNVTITSESFFNRSASNVDCSGMDLLEQLDESLTATTANTHFNALKLSFGGGGAHHHQSSHHQHQQHQQQSHQGQRPSLKALTSTVSAQRTQSQINVNKAATTTSAHDMDAAAKTSDAAATDVTSTAAPTTTAATIKGVKFLIDQTEHAPSCATTHASMASTNRAHAASSLMSGGRMVGGANSSNSNDASFAIRNSCAFSRKIAEYFVAQQAHLIENNEYEALSPVELQSKIDELISYDATFSDAHYLKYLNCLRLRDYPSALKSLHDYFDRIFLTGSVSLAALNLSSLEYRFDSK